MQKAILKIEHLKQFNQRKTCFKIGLSRSLGYELHFEKFTFNENKIKHNVFSIVYNIVGKSKQMICLL